MCKCKANLLPNLWGGEKLKERKLFTAAPAAAVIIFLQEVGKLPNRSGISYGPGISEMARKKFLSSKLSRNLSLPPQLTKSIRFQLYSEPLEGNGSIGGNHLALTVHEFAPWFISLFLFLGSSPLSVVFPYFANAM